jgi:hypothetical protein
VHRRFVLGTQPTIERRGAIKDNVRMAENRPLFSDRAIQIVAENKIRSAIEAGEFDNLPGFGQPAAIFDEPYDPHWWIRRKLQREELSGLANLSRAGRSLAD